MSAHQKIKKDDLNDDVKISRLSNSIYFYLDCALIVKVNDDCRLVVFKNSQRLIDLKYESAKGARIAFQRLFKGTSWKRDVRGEWSHFYVPDKDWLDEKGII